MSDTATKVQHTPGPWKVYARATKSSNFGGYSNLVHATDDRGPCSVARVRGGNHDDREVVDANARLIAAAPELLEACKRALPHHQGGHSEVGALLRAAIANASGEV